MEKIYSISFALLALILFLVEVKLIFAFLPFVIDKVCPELATLSAVCPACHSVACALAVAARL